jgi:hypothetical protein
MIYTSVIPVPPSTDPLDPEAAKLHIIRACREMEITWEQRVHLLQLIEFGGPREASELLEIWRTA